jgi:site-specific DNA-methyltransferase (adenine-specific)
MDAIADGSVALVVTSPPYFAGKTYEEELQTDGVPSTYLEYLELLRDVFAECVTKLEPGGRLAINVANLGRKPFRSLAADVIRILEYDLGLLLRGEIVWQKGEGASGSCAWGSYRSASNPVLRDLTERVIIASKGHFDRALSVKERAAKGLPHESTISTDDFLTLTLDVWSIPPESARRIGHPAPFPIELPAQLIRLLTFKDDLVLDPFMGSGSTLVAASLLSRRFAGYDLDPEFVELARTRVHQEGTPVPTINDEGLSLGALCEHALETAGFQIVAKEKRIPKTALNVDVVVSDRAETPWYIEIAGTASAHRPGLSRQETVVRSLGRISALRGRLGDDTRFLLLCAAPPEPKSEADTVLRAAGPSQVFDVINVLDSDSLYRLAEYAKGSLQIPGFWSVAELSQ